MKRIDRGVSISLSLGLVFLLLSIAPTSAQEALTVSPSGKVGIGTDSPAYDLHLLNSAASANVWIEGALSGAMEFVDGDAPADERIAQFLSTNGTFRIRGLTDALAQSVPGIVLDLSSGDVGIGTTTPATKLHVTERIRIDGDGNNPQMDLYFSEDRWWRHSVNSNNVYAFRDVGGSTNPFVLEGGAPTGSFIVKSTGRVGIGTSSPGLRLAVEDPSTSGAVLRLQNDSQICDYNPDLTPTCPSDKRLKRNIHPLDTAGVLAELGRIELFEYELIASGEGAIGPVAQELQRTHPGRVSEREDGMLVATMPSRMELLAAIQALKGMVVGLQAEMARLRAASE